MRTVKFTNLDKTLWPEAGITKGQLIEYLGAVGGPLLLELRNRPLTVVRAPDGIDKFTFFQKKAPDYTPEWVKTVTLPAPSTKKDVHYILSNRLDDLKWLGNQASIEFHTWISRVPRIQEPDLLAFDLDPAEGDFDLAVEAARLLVDVLREVKLTPAMKTTGGKGLHLFVHLSPGHNYPQVHQAALTLANRAIEIRPDLVTLEMRKDSRKGRVLIDIGRNSPGATVVAAFSPRKRPHATVSFPVQAADLDNVRPEDFTIKTVPDLINSPAFQNWQDSKKRRRRLPSPLSA